MTYPINIHKYIPITTTDRAINNNNTSLKEFIHRRAMNRRAMKMSNSTEFLLRNSSVFFSIGHRKNDENKEKYAVQIIFVVIFIQMMTILHINKAG